MKIVIDIDEDTYKDIKKGKIYSSMRDVPQESVLAIANGTPLPKGHGKIAGLSAVYEDICNDLNEMTRIGVVVDGDWLWAKLNDAIDHAPTIIEGSDEECK